MIDYESLSDQQLIQLEQATGKLSALVINRTELSACELIEGISSILKDVDSDIHDIIISPVFGTNAVFWIEQVTIATARTIDMRGARAERSEIDPTDQ